MTTSAVASRYANALADVVTASGSNLQPQAAATQLRSFAAAISASPELANALITPAVPAVRKRAVVGRIAERLGLAQVSRNFLYVLVDKRRIGALSQIIQAFEQVVDERLGFARAEVASAAALTDEQRAALNTRLEKLTGKRVRAHYSVDGSLIGGVVARIGSTVYDGSVRGQLATLGRRLAAE
jgi:F-type H+-transporting ATPase subunit delta